MNFKQKDLRGYDPQELKRQRRRNWLVALFIFLVAIFAASMSMFHYHRTSTSDQNKLFNSNEPIVVMFYSSTCKDCQSVESYVTKTARLSKINSQVKHGVMFIQLQNKHDQKSFKKYKITSTPTFMVMKKGVPQAISNHNGVKIYRYAGTDQGKIKQIYTQLRLGE